MKREIKFRGKRVDNGEWICGNLFIPNKLVRGIYICPETTYGDMYPSFEDGNDIKEWEGKGIALGHFHEVIPGSVEQFIGLHDRNGKEVYEGDIIKNEFGKKVIKWGDGGFYCDEEKTVMRIYLWILDFSKIEVIGNIFENPELL